MSGRELLKFADVQLSGWMAENGILLTRLAPGIVFLWFGVLKFFPGMSDADDLVKRTIVKLTLGEVPPQVCLYVLASWECVIGLGFISGQLLRVTLVLLFLQLPGTFLPLLFFSSETWKHAPYAPTFEGRYIIKNLILIAAGIVVGSTARGGTIISEPHAARVAGQIQKAYSRFRRKFRREPSGVIEREDMLAQEKGTDRRMRVTASRMPRD